MAASKHIGMVLAALFSLVATLCCPLVCQAGHPARDQLESSINEILQVLKDPSLKVDGRSAERREKLRGIAGRRFDYRKMTQLSLGKHWKSRNQAEKDEVTRLFTRLLEDTYMGKIEAYTDEKIIFLKELEARKKVQIDTKIVTQTVEIPIDYRMYEGKPGIWMVYDLVIEGVSLVGNYRSQFGRILDSESFDALISRLKEKQ